MYFQCSRVLWVQSGSCGQYGQHKCFGCFFGFLSGVTKESKPTIKPIRAFENRIEDSLGSNGNQESQNEGGTGEHQDTVTGMKFR